MAKQLVKSVTPKGKKRPDAAAKRRHGKIIAKAERGHIRLPQRSDLAEGVEKAPGVAARSTEGLDPKTASQDPVFKNKTSHA